MIDPAYSEAHIERAIDRRVMKRLATDPEYRYAEDAEAQADATGDEYRVWLVTPCDDDGEPTGPSASYPSRNSALTAAMARAVVLGIEVAE